MEQLFPVSDRLPSDPLLFGAAIVPVFYGLTGGFNWVSCKVYQVRKGSRRS